MRDREQAIEAALDRIEWYVRCLRDCWAGRVVRGLDEAEAGYTSALDDLRAALPDPVHEAARAVVAAFYDDVDDPEDATPRSDAEVDEAVDRLRAALAAERVPTPKGAVMPDPVHEELRACQEALRFHMGKALAAQRPDPVHKAAREFVELVDDNEIQGHGEYAALMSLRAALADERVPEGGCETAIPAHNPSTGPTKEEA